SEFKRELENKNIQELTISGDQIRGSFKTVVEDKARFVTTLVEPSLSKELDQYGVKYGRVIESTWFSDLLSIILPTLFFLGIWYFFIRNALSKNLGSGGLMSVGKSKAKIFVEQNTKTTFKDVAGADEALEELKEVIEFLKNSEKVKTLGGKMPKGI